MAFTIFKSCGALATAVALLGGCAKDPRPALALAASETDAADPMPDRRERVPSAAEIFDFHPRGTTPGSWREPFVVSYTEGPLNAYRLRTLAELKRLEDHRYDFAAAPH